MSLPTVYSNDVYIFLSTCSMYVCMYVKQNAEIMQDDNLQSQESEQNCLISVMVLPPYIKQYKHKHQV